MATIPASDLDRARDFYEEMLGLTGEVRPDGVLYTGMNSAFLLFPSSGRASGDYTQMAFGVDDLDATMAALRAHGVTFEAFDMPGFDRETMTMTMGPSRGAWFRDTEGNLLVVEEEVAG